ncbi:unnamed protein product [Didymodactylos carnosus]|uniref:E3 ubiquitin-protein ligase PPP1R11 n=1 Tax=Didymodactylos carnosus TaxID=1234261 RepID=A0A813TFI7_9BILA|nr:unnamed protein product [Didymodactylos carnosus]CAF1168014.1 unnamed protein product [Didymodactylos carnosus]CAF3593874.1 unnamed protein product [Didymodactylos carnosus]CAF3979477.1 unnamed protein product [Didymodactylos carnosus]
MSRLVQQQLSQTLVDDQQKQQITSVITNKTLHLRLKNALSIRQHVVWDETTVVDNEFENKKKSKCCCIYTKSEKENIEIDNDKDKQQPIIDEEFDNCKHCRFHTQKDYSTATKKEDEKEAGPHQVRIVVAKTKTGIRKNF